MEKELDPEVIKATQNSLGKYVKRPPLTDKLLKKPPFRFLHDIVTTVIKSTGFLEGLFEENELVSDNVKDRESKILFLNKVISVLNLTTGKSLSVKPSKVIAGQEPDKTNELLQCIAEALDNKLSSDEAVKKYKESTNTSKNLHRDEKKSKQVVNNLKTSQESKKLTSRSSEKLTSQTNDSKISRERKERSQTRSEKDKSNNVSKSKLKENISKKESSSKNSSQPTKTLNKKNTVEKVQGEKHQLETDNSKISTKTPNNDNQHSIEIDETQQSFTGDKEILGEATASNHSDQRHLNATSYTIICDHKPDSHDLLDVVENTDVSNDESNIKERTQFSNEDQLPKGDSDTDNNKAFNEKDSIIITGAESEVISKSSHSSASSRDTKSSTREKDRNWKSNNHDSSISETTKVAPTVRPVSVRPPSSRPGAPRLRDKHENSATEAGNLLVGKVNIIVENNANEEEEESSIIIVEQQLESNSTPLEQDQFQLSSNQHGHLVQQILDSQKEFIQTAGKTEIEWQFGAQKAREALNQEIEQLRFNIQAVSRAANPLGKVLDHIQEDVEVMRQELQQWATVYEDTHKQLLNQKMANDDSLLPLQTRLKQLDADIKEKGDKINDLKLVIHKNASRIDKLLASEWSGKVQY